MDKMTFTLEDDFQKDREPRQIYEGKLLVKANIIYLGSNWMLLLLNGNTKAVT